MLFVIFLQYKDRKHVVNIGNIVKRSINSVGVIQVYLLIYRSLPRLIFSFQYLGKNCLPLKKILLRIVEICVRIVVSLYRIKKTFHEIWCITMDLFQLCSIMRQLFVFNYYWLFRRNKRILKKHPSFPYYVCIYMFAHYLKCLVFIFIWCVWAILKYSFMYGF